MRQRVASVAGYTCLLIGLLDIASAIRPGMRDGRIARITHYVPGFPDSLARATSLAAGILLVMLARGLARRKLRAWRAAVVLLGPCAVIQSLRHHEIIPAVVSAALCGVLIAYRKEFYALGDPRTRVRAIGNFILVGLCSVGLGLAIVGVRAHEESGGRGIGFSDRLQQVLYGMAGLDGPIAYTSPRVADLVSFCLLALGLVTACTTAYLALRPARHGLPDPEGGEEKLRALLEKDGARDSLGYFALRRDKSVMWSPTGKAAIAYRVVSGVALASGDPIGDYEAWPGAIKEFLDQCAKHAWTPGVMGCSELGGQVWTREGGLHALELGDEAIVDTKTFSLSGRTMRNVRQMVNRIERAGYSCQVRHVRDLPKQEKKKLREDAAAWRGSATERGFSMALGRFGAPGDGDCVVVTAHQPDENGVDRVRALLHFVPWGPDGISLDLMRRDRTAEPGLNELLIVAALKAAPGLGINKVSLNFAVFRAALARGEKLGAGPVLRIWHRLLVFSSRWFQIESLYRFNAKFQPVWEPRFVVYPTSRDLPRISWACMQAEAFVVLPRPAERLRQYLRSKPRYVKIRRSLPMAGVQRG
ncbi:phosphatidylglycerol lysyltransferase domain-containing protein [Streptomyces varsoviensis]|uniref:phosphatidylglycerol lysyltransferase domain-containing protein n=1 Tax=Streptomyces varsoviensis TaxID=67373 RepID=UPI0033F2D8A0